jgi:hypothetical protein
MSVLSVGGVYVPFRSFRPSTLEVHVVCDGAVRQTSDDIMDALIHIARNATFFSADESRQGRASGTVRY